MSDTHPAINQLRRILSWAGVPDTDATARAVAHEGLTNDVDGALEVMWKHRRKVGALSYMIAEVEAKWKVEREARGLANQQDMVQEAA